jgi:PKD repeat protein
MHPPYELRQSFEMYLTVTDPLGASGNNNIILLLVFGFMLIILYEGRDMIRLIPEGEVNTPPVASMTAKPLKGEPPLTVEVSAHLSIDLDSGNIYFFLQYLISSV